MANEQQTQVDFRTRDMVRDQEGYLLMRKGSIHGEDETLLTMYALTTKLQNTRSKTDTPGGRQATPR